MRFIISHLIYLRVEFSALKALKLRQYEFGFLLSSSKTGELDLLSSQILKL